MSILKFGMKGRRRGKKGCLSRRQIFILFTKEASLRHPKKVGARAGGGGSTSVAAIKMVNGELWPIQRRVTRILGRQAFMALGARKRSISKTRSRSFHRPKKKVKNRKLKLSGCFLKNRARVMGIAFRWKKADVRHREIL